MENINNLFRSELSNVVDETLFNNDGDNYYGNYVGRVVNNEDPEKLGRCQIRVFCVFEENRIKDEDLPWAMPDMNFIGSKVGSFVVPPVGAIVKVYFNNGDIYQPHYTTKILDKNNLPSRRMKKYPNNIVFFETDNGDYFEIDRENSTTKFNHKSGTNITIYSNGDVSINCPGKVFSINGAKVSSLGGTESTNLGGNMKVLYSLTGQLPTDAEGRPLQGIGVSEKVTVGF